MKYNKYALLCAFFASLGGLEFGYDQGVVSPQYFSILVCSSTEGGFQIANVLVMKDFMQRWPITPLQKGIMSVSP